MQSERESWKPQPIIPDSIIPDSSGGAKDSGTTASRDRLPVSARPAEKPRGDEVWSKVPAVTFMFWVIKILATTVGETGGDALSMQLKLGYAISTMIFLGFFAVTVTAQISWRRFHPFIYWAVVVATTTVGTTLSDYLDRTLKLGYARSSIALFCGVLLVLFVWKRSTGRIAVDHITMRKNELFYWLTILVSNTLGTALGDLAASTTGLGFERGAMVFAVLLVLVAMAYFVLHLPESIAFWAAYVLTRPLGATLGDTLTKSHAEGGLALSRIASSLTIAAAMAVTIVWTYRHGRTDPHSASA